jgi:tetratricopeptide (TPR) repeat protein
MAHMHLGLAYKRERSEGNGEPNLAAALQQYETAKKILEELIREYPDRVHYDYMNMVCGNVQSAQFTLGTTDGWLRAEEDFRKHYLRRADELKEDEALLWAANRGWQAYKDLTERGRNDLTTKWAQTACQDLRAFIGRQPKELPTALRETRTYFPGELHNYGFAAEAAEFDEKLRPFLRKPEDLGRFLAVRGSYVEAARHYQAAARQDPTNYKAASAAALLLLFIEDRAAYEAICRQMLDQFQETRNAEAARLTCFACLISPFPVGNLEQLVPLADLAVKRKDSVDPGLRSLLNSLRSEARGLAAYRAGDFKGTIKWCAESRQHGELKERPAHSLILEAMALQRLKRTTDAKSAFDQAIQLKSDAFPDQDVVFKPYWFDWIAFDLLRREAESLLQLCETDSTQP